MLSYEPSYKPEHDDDSDGELSNSYGLEYKDDLKDEILQALKDGTLENFVAELCKEHTDERAKALLAHIIVMILQSETPKLFVCCLCIAIGFNSLIGGASGEEIGNRYGMTRQNVHEIVDKIRSRLNLTNQLRTAKSAEARKAYKKFNKVREKEIR